MRLRARALASAFVLASPLWLAVPSFAERVLRLDESPIGEIDPAKATDYADTVLMSNIYDTLVYPKAGGPGVEPLLATEWTTDGNSYTFKLKDGVKFHSGNPLTADDVVFSLNRMIAMGQGFSSLFAGRVEKAEAIDPLTVKFTLTEPYAPFLAALVRLPVVDAKTVMANKADGKHGEFGDYGEAWMSSHDAGSGAYKVESQNPQSETVMVKFPDYFLGFAENAPDKVRYRYGLEAPTVRALMSRGEHDIGKYVAAAQEGANRAAALTQRLLAFARKQPLAPQTVDPNRFVSGISEMLQRTLTEAIRIETVLAAGLWKVHVDPAQLENALLNLAVNARDAMPAGGRLTIETANTSIDGVYSAANSDVPAGQYVMVAVTDTGTGMPPDVVARAFEPFFTTKGVGKGSGLGLSQVYGFVRQSGGHVKIYSEPGQGTSIKIYLPRYYGLDQEVDRSGKASAARPEGSHEEVVLVVEDEANVRRLSVDSLRELGYTVLHADHAERAMQLIETLPRIDLLFTDIIMPDVNGRELSDRARVASPGIKVLFTTGYTRNAVVHNGLLDPGVRLLGKPFTIEQLAVSVRAAIDG